MRTFVFVILLLVRARANCPLGQFYNTAFGGFGDVRCRPCYTGRYADETGLTECKKCVAGKYNDAGSSISEDACKDCTAGKYSHEGYGQCSDCGVGNYSTAIAASSCNRCPIKQYQDERGSTECKDCELGKYNDEHGLPVCKDCAAGQYNDERGLDVCKDCGTGKYSDVTGLAICKDCDVNTFANETGLTECKPCASGKFQPLLGKDFCGCDRGFFYNSSGCYECEPGKYQDEQAKQTCKDCAIGKYQGEIGKISCKDCPNSKGTENEGSTTEEECTTCIPGRYAEYGENDILLKCTDCEKGKYQNYKTQDGCFVCPSGRYGDQTGLAECKECVPGKYQASAGMQICDECPRGRYQYKYGSPMCLNCPNGRSHIFTGVSSSAKCIDFFQRISNLPRPVLYTKECQIRDDFTIQCPYCSCFDDSRRGHFDGPVCQQCKRGFGTSSCKPKCPEYDTISDNTICSQMGSCYFGTSGDSVCYCGADGSVDQNVMDVVVDVRDDSLERYFKMYMLDFSVIRIEMPLLWKPDRPMKFQLFDPSDIRQNKCSSCHKEPSEDAPNGYTASNCQYECSVCLFSGKCDNMPRNAESHTICSCRSIAYGTLDLCCPKGFRAYVDDGTDRLPYVRELKPTLMSTSYYSDNVFHGNEKDLCLPCPGLFGLGVYESSTQLMTAAEATEFWWTRPLAAFTKTCNAVGTCDFYHDKSSFQFSGNRDNLGMCMTFRGANKRSTGSECQSHQDCESGYCDLDNEWGCLNTCLRGFNGVEEKPDPPIFNPNDFQIYHVQNHYFNDFNDSITNVKKYSGQSCTNNDECLSNICGKSDDCSGKCLEKQDFVMSGPIGTNTFTDIIDEMKKGKTFSKSGVTFTLQESCPDVEGLEEGRRVYKEYSLQELYNLMSLANFVTLVKEALDELYRSKYDSFFMYEEYMVFYKHYAQRGALTNLGNVTNQSFKIDSQLSLDEYNCKLEEGLPTFLYEAGDDPVIGGNCPQGYYCYDGLKIPCPAGHYSSIEGLFESFNSNNISRCKPCEAGKSTNGLTGQRECFDCPAGRYVKGGYNNSENQQVGGEDCSLCPANSYQPNSPPYMPLHSIGNEKTDVDGDNNPREPINGVVTCISCGIKVAPPGSSRLSDCESCEPNTGLLPGSIYCQNCTVGKYYSYGKCDPCQTGKYNDEEGMGECKNCERGKFQEDLGKTVCVDCPVGRYQRITGQDACNACPRGRFQGSTGQEACDACPTGKYQGSEGRSSCKDCVSPLFQPTEGQSSCRSRTPCKRGGNNNNGKVSCSKRGHIIKYKQNGYGPSEDYQCEACPAGKFARYDNQVKCVPIFQRIRDNAIARPETYIGYGNGYDCLDAFTSRPYTGGLVTLARNYYTGQYTRSVECKNMFGCIYTKCNGDKAKSYSIYEVCWTVQYRTVFTDRNLPYGGRRDCYYTDKSPNSYPYDNTAEYSIFASFRCNGESEKYDYAPRRRFDYRL